MGETLSQEELLEAIKLARTLPADQRDAMLQSIETLLNHKTLNAAQTNFMSFVKKVWPEFIEGAHHRKVAQIYDDVIEGRKKRVIINMAPRHTKSEFASWLLPAYALGRNPSRKIIQTGHTTDFSVGFGRKVRNLVNGAAYSEIFPNTTLAHDSKAAGRWTTNQRGEYYACGTGAALAGRGADLLIIDDPHSEQDAMSPALLDQAYEWYTSGPRQRLQPGGAIIIVMTRWDERDLTGRVMEDQIKKAGSDEWEILTLPAILDEYTETERPIWPGYWKIEELRRTRAGLPVGKWQAQYQQEPTSEEGALIKREWWVEWPHAAPPKVNYILQSWDTAHSATTTADYSACTTWGIFDTEDTQTGKQCSAIILLDAFKERLEFPQLKQRALDMYRRWQPDSVIIEAKAAGAPLISELRRIGVPVSDFTPSRGNDKITRVNAIADIFCSGLVYYPKGKRYADEVIHECAAFPNGKNDDYVDTVSQALLRFRKGGMIALRSDFRDEEEHPGKRQRRRAYY